MSPAPKLAGGATAAGRHRPGGDQGTEDGAAAQRGPAGYCALAQEAQTGVAGNRIGGLANGSVDVNVFKLEILHRDVSF